MAESVVSFVVQRLGDALIQEVNFLIGVREQFELLQKELISIIGFLKTADAHSCEDPDVRTWVADVRDIAYDVDDVIDKFFLKVASQEEGDSNNVLKQYFCMPKKIVDVYNIGKEIESIFTKIDDISNRRKRYGITNMVERGASSSTSNNEMSLRRSYPHAKDDVVVGMEEEINSLVAELLKAQEHRSVISIYGMGGLGKTTLAKRVYNHNDIRSHFDSHAWTFVSQQCRIVEVLQEILRKVSTLTNTDIEKMKEVELVETLADILEGKRFLVVLDDIWSKEAWDILKPAFPKGKTGSKVLLTTRNIEIAMHADPWSRHFEPRHLTNEEAWALICMKSFPVEATGTSWALSDDIEKCGRQMVTKCSGLPLAVVILGGILATKKSLNEWKTVSKDIGLYMTSGDAGVFAILALSYHDLSYHLKPLFLYLGLFPEDFRIPVKVLIQMWIAESMVIQNPGNQLTLEEMGRQYLDELIHRCMVQVSKRNSAGRVKTCQLHDTMRELCIVKAREENFFEIIQKGVSLDSSFSVATPDTKLRRCAIYLEDERYSFPWNLIPRLRAVIFVKSISPTRLNIVYQDLKLVKVLELQGVTFNSKFFREFYQLIGKLINLRYLGLRNMLLPRLPQSIGNLALLQTLDVRNTAAISLKLPNALWKMKHLRHFYVDECCTSSRLLRMDTLRKLQTLSGIRVGPWIHDLIKLNNLVKLCVTKLTPATVKVVMKSILDGLDNLQYLTLCMGYVGIPFSDLGLLSRKHNLLELRLTGKIESFPSQWPANLVKLRLVLAELNQDPMPVLEKLQHLVYLRLWDSYEGKEMVCSRKGFVRLEYLEIGCSHQLEEWRVEEGAMPSLETVNIVYCRKLKMFPTGFTFVSTLQKLQIGGMPIDFIERVKQGGEDWSTVQHIPSVNLEYMIPEFYDNKFYNDMDN